MLLSFALIAGGAVLFTNAVEWLGHRLELGASAVGSLLAAVGTALPESTIPIVALVGGGGSSKEVAIGAILGAPFLLATLAMVLIGASTAAFSGRRESGRKIRVEERSMQRDLAFFLACFAVGVGVGLGVPSSVRIPVAIGLVLAYGVYSYVVVKRGQGSEHEENLGPLTFDRSGDDEPATWKIVAQVLVGIAAIVGGAELFVEEVTKIAESIGVGPLLLSLVLAPLATELPEKANSIIWVRENKDSLAIGNVTGAMVFQSTVPLAFGLVFTEWHLDPASLAAGGVGLAGGALTIIALRRRSFSLPFVGAWSALIVGFMVFALSVESAPTPPSGSPPPGAPPPALPPPPGAPPPSAAPP